MSTKKPSKPKKTRSTKGLGINYTDELLRIQGIDVSELRKLDARYRKEVMPRLAELNARNLKNGKERVDAHLELLHRLRGAVDLDDCPKGWLVQDYRPIPKWASSGAGEQDKVTSSKYAYSGPGLNWDPQEAYERLPTLPMQYLLPGCTYDRYEAYIPPLDYELQPPPTSNPMWIDLATLDIDVMQTEPGLALHFIGPMPGMGYFTGKKIELYKSFDLVPIGAGRWCFTPDISILGQGAWEVVPPYGTDRGGTVELRLWWYVAVQEYDSSQVAHYTTDSMQVTILSGTTVGNYAQDIVWTNLSPDGLKIQARLTGDGRPVIVSTRMQLIFNVSGNASADIDLASVQGYGFRYNGLKYGHYRGRSFLDYMAPAY